MIIGKVTGKNTFIKSVIHPLIQAFLNITKELSFYKKMFMSQRTITFAIVLIAICCSSFSTPSLTVSISNLRNSKGQVLFAVFNQKEGYPTQQKKAFIRKVAQVKNQKATYTFYNLKKGKYAIAAVHDKNFNEKIDKNLIGVPVEGYGFSNIPNPNLRVPSFKKAAFELKNNAKRLKIKLFYAF